ncbi:hypothetical protein GCM10027258_62660 [Amycolatopsis stemonae]
MTARDAADELLAEMLAAWRRDIDDEPFPTFEAAVLRGEHSTAHELAAR